MNEELLNKNQTRFYKVNSDNGEGGGEDFYFNSFKEAKEEIREWFFIDAESFEGTFIEFQNLTYMIYEVNNDLEHVSYNANEFDISMDDVGLAEKDFGEFLW